VVTLKAEQEVSSQLFAPKAKNAPCPIADDGGVAVAPPSGAAFHWAGGVFAAAAMLRRRKR
jgi:hypothetical protein